MPQDTDPVVPTRLASVSREVHGTFDDQAKFDAALDRLRQNGFDRAELSVPEKAVGGTTPDGAPNPNSPIDRQQARTIAGSTTGITAAMIGAGVTVATGGAAAVAAGVAVAAGLAAGGAAHAVTAIGMGADAVARDERAARSELVLAVRVADDDAERAATETLRACGAISVEAV